MTTPETSPATRLAAARLYYLDYLRAAVVALVMLHHAAITYGAAGSWYYSDAATSKWVHLALTWFVAVNQAWFMAFLFFLSGYLSLASYTRKGVGRYVTDRLRRFGIPILVYAFVISPVVTWLVVAAGPGTHPSLFAYWESEYLSLRIIDTGPLWFVWALLLMDLLFVVWARWLSRVDLRARRPGLAFPSRLRLSALAVGLGLAAFAVRQAVPVGATVLFGLQIAYFPDYVAMFILGFFAWRYRWLDEIPDAAFRFARVAVIAGILAFPFLMIVGTLTTSDPSAAFAGGLHWQALAYALWSPWVLVGMSIVLLSWGRRRLNRPFAPWQEWSAGSYVAYILQPLVLVPLGILFHGVPWPAIAKWAVVGPTTVVVTYGLARAVRWVGPVRWVVG